MGFKTIYLTGAPASGKSTTSRKLLDAVQDIKLWDYGQRLLNHVNTKRSTSQTYEQLREKSSTIINPEDVRDVDHLLVEFVTKHRRSKHIIIDSHPVTKESYGFRCTAFSAAQISAIAPDEIWVLYADPEVTINRIEASSGGRPSVDVEAARMHTILQASVAASYGITTGRPVYFFDSDMDQDNLVKMLTARLTRHE